MADTSRDSSSPDNPLLAREMLLAFGLFVGVGAPLVYAVWRIRRLTEDYELPAEACGTWQALWHGLEDLEKTMHEHVHLESILFPRVSAG